MLNAHATVLAKSPFPLGGSGGDIHSGGNQETAISRLQAAFIEFVTSVKDGGLRKEYLKDTSAPETAAYWAFWQTHTKWLEFLEKENRIEG